MQLEDLLTEADVGESYDVDPVLQEDCGNVVESVCSHVRPGEGRYANDCIAANLPAFGGILPLF